MGSIPSNPKLVAATAEWGERAASAEFVEKIPIGFARRHLVLGLASDEPRLPVAMTEPVNLEMLQIVSRTMHRPVRAVIAGEAEIRSAINAAYQERTGQAQAVIQKMERADVLQEVEHLADREDLLDADSRAPVIKLVNLILFEAVKSRASDVHVQPYEQTLVVRLRIDGILYDSFSVPKNLQNEVVGRIKVMGRMNIAERRLPQDGRASVQVGDKTVDLRISSLPTRFGERVVIRLLDKSHRLFNLTELGMDAQTLTPFRQLIAAEHGIILVTGPTGSGKTTTLYSALQELNAKERNILTLEDPIEYGLEGVSQTQVSDKKGMTFASGLRTVLRQDPDVIMVGEIRDQETAAMAIQSALTGHLVFSTLHTNDAATAITRLLDLGVEPFLVASSVIGVLAQRLVRRVCPRCGVPVQPTAAQLLKIGLEGSSVNLSGLRSGTGCDNCRGSGYSGRLGLFELLRIGDDVRRNIGTGANASQIATAAVTAGMRTLRDDGITRALEGQTTLEEVVRVTMQQEID
jgi:general secretion pathway protein E